MLALVGDAPRQKFVPRDERESFEVTLTNRVGHLVMRSVREIFSGLMLMGQTIAKMLSLAPCRVAICIPQEKKHLLNHSAQSNSIDIYTLSMDLLG